MALHGKELAKEAEELRLHRLALVVSRWVPVTSDHLIIGGNGCGCQF
jgi:hypothetical protein